VEGGGFRYILKDHQSEEIFEFGEAEHFLCQQLDGHTPLGAVQLAFQNHFDIPLHLDQLEAFARQLESLGLLQSTNKKFKFTQTFAESDKLYRLCNPDIILDILSGVFSWCFSSVFAIIFFVVLVLGLGISLKYWSVFVDEIGLVWEKGIFLLLPIIGIFVINVLSEIAKGVACKHYGGHVYNLGMYFIFRIIPRFYCDISDAFWMKEKSQRIRILSAGLICQLLLWGIGIIGWKNTYPWTKIHIFWLFFTLAATIFFLLNFIPFFQRDGYLLLSTWLGISDLKNRAVALVKSWIFRKPLPEPLSSREILVFKRYVLMYTGFSFTFWAFLLAIAGYFLCLYLKGIGALIFLTILYLRFEHVLRRR
jgi:putative peptide zinc metalloprotease protein